MNATTLLVHKIKLLSELPALSASLAVTILIITVLKSFVPHHTRESLCLEGVVQVLNNTWGKAVMIEDIFRNKFLGKLHKSRRNVILEDDYVSQREDFL